MRVQQLQLDKLNTNHRMDDKQYTLLDSEKQPTGEFTGISLKKSNLLFSIGDDKLFLIDDCVYNEKETLILKGYKSHYEKNNTIYITDTKGDIYKVKRNGNYFQNNAKMSRSSYGNNIYSNIVGENLALVCSYSKTYLSNYLINVDNQILLLSGEEKGIFEYSLNNEKGKKLVDLPDEFVNQFTHRSSKNDHYFSSADGLLNFFIVTKDHNIEELAYHINIFQFNLTRNTYNSYRIKYLSLLGFEDYNASLLSIQDLKIKTNILTILYYDKKRNHDLIELQYDLSTNLKISTNILISYPSRNPLFYNNSTFDILIAKYEDEKVISLKREKALKTEGEQTNYLQLIYFNVIENGGLISSHYSLKKIDQLLYNNGSERTKQNNFNSHFFLYNGLIQKGEKKDSYNNQSYSFNPNYPTSNTPILPTAEEINDIFKKSIIDIKYDDPPHEFNLGEEIFITGKKITYSLGLEYVLGQNVIFEYYFLRTNVPYWFLKLPSFTGQKNYQIDINDKNKVLKSTSYTNAITWNKYLTLYTPAYNMADYKEDSSKNPTSNFISLGIRKAREVSICTETERGNTIVFREENKVCYFLDFYNQLTGNFQGESEEILDITSIKDGTFIATNSKLLLQTVIGTNSIEYYNQEINVGYDVEFIGEKIICYYTDNLLKYVYDNSLIEMFYPINTPPKKVIKKRNVLLLQDVKNRIWIITPKERSFALLSLSEEKSIELSNLITDHDGNTYALEKGTCKFRFSYSRGSSPIVLKKISSYSPITGGSVLFENNNKQLLNVVKWRDKYTLPSSIAMQRHKEIQINFDESIGNNITLEYI